MSPGSVKILLVDDLEANLFALANVLLDPSYVIHTANNGNDALALLLEHDFAVVLMDVCMPDMDGFETASLMRSHERTKTTPIIFVSAVNREEVHALRGYELGAVDYLFKPLQPEAVQSKVRVFAELAMQRRTITEQNAALVALNTDLVSAREDADRANAAKSAFLAHMSHEIRTPLTAIIGYAELLLQSNSPSAEALSQLGVIRRNGQHLLALINDVLDLSKIEAGRIDIEAKRFALLPELRAVEAMFLQQARNKDIELTLEARGLIPEEVTSDAHKVRQVLINLVGNAIKFTSRGSIRMTVSTEMSTSVRGPMLEIRVTDTGCGIAEHSRDQVFEAFRQADSSITRKFGGTGLGLTLSQKLAQHLGGAIVIEQSVVDAGSTFLFTFDPGSLTDVKMLADVTRAAVGSAVKPEKLAAARHLLAGRKILLAEDSGEIRLLLDAILRSAGAEVVLACNGQDAVEKAKAAHFDLILMDMEMPIMDGREATRTLRASGFQLPILALTAHVLSEEIAKTLAAGCNAHISKPATIEMLVEESAKWIAGTASLPNPPTRASATRHLASNTLSGSFDQTIALRRIGGNVETLRSVAKMFAAQKSDLLAPIAAGIDDFDYHHIENAAHKLKGAVGMFAADSAFSAAEQLEHHCREQNLPEVKQAFGRLSQELERLTMDLSQI